MQKHMTHNMALLGQVSEFAESHWTLGLFLLSATDILFCLSMQTSSINSSFIPQSSFLSELLSSCVSHELDSSANSRSPGFTSWIAWYLCSSR